MNKNKNNETLTVERFFYFFIIIILIWVSICFIFMIQVSLDKTDHLNQVCKNLNAIDPPTCKECIFNSYIQDDPRCAKASKFNLEN